MPEMPEQPQGFPYGAIFEGGGTINTWRSTRQSNPRQAEDTGASGFLFDQN
jgi:hypothetical protein